MSIIPIKPKIPRLKNPRILELTRQLVRRKEKQDFA